MGGEPKDVAAGVKLYSHGLRGGANEDVDIVDVILTVSEANDSLVITSGGVAGGAPELD